MRFLKPFVFVACLIYGLHANSQYYYYNDRYYEPDILFEFGGGIGAMNCITDLGGSKNNSKFYLSELTMKNSQLSGSVYFGIMYQHVVGARLEATWGSVTAYDSILKGGNSASQDRFRRNLNFKSTINEISLIGEFHPLALMYTDGEPSNFSPYIAAGIGYFSFNPQATVNGRTFDLRPLRTEGQGFSEFPGTQPYHLKQVNVPVGIGVRYEISSLFHARFEVLHRFLFTDHLDDVSGKYIDKALFSKYLSPVQAAQANSVYSLNQFNVPLPGIERGNSDSKDSYMTFNLKIGLTLGRAPR